MSKPIEFSMATIDHDDLAAICRWCVDHPGRWDALTSWLVDVVGGEALRRAEGEGELPEGLADHPIAVGLRKTRGASAPAAEYIAVPFDNWSDADCGDALLGITLLSYGEGVSEPLGRLVEALVLHIVAETRRRLLQRDAARCN